ncbi:aKG-HExxH-type peptide beta-hydroxylase [Nocardiopsis aegyptia]|uniref:HEXXH motif-containing protein n=1 Tax=Nocardiopsis aegyptia TaxID=220378 RepID=A0A7Z0ET54_9ACTN|nr:HEXXH motif-containing putative peptide modification protein [Nocardiopsis aegyptia]NYJ37829.1 HEXXH motif-containing protein [Nocardiopsis aegyptia]
MTAAVVPIRRPVPGPVFDALARGGGGARAARYLREAEYGKHLLLVRQVVDAAIAREHPLAERARAAYDLLMRAEEAAPAAVARVLSHPTVGAWARRTALSLEGHRTDPPRVAAMSALAAATAVRSGTEARVSVPLYGPTAPLPGLGRALLRPGGAEEEAVLEADAHTAELSLGRVRVRIPDDPHEDTGDWHALRRLSAEHRGRRLDLLLDDQDADRLSGGAVRESRLAADQVTRLRDLLRQAWAILVEHHWTIAGEVGETVRTLTPMRADPGARVSATARHCFGNLGLSEPSDPLWLALTFAHEVQHTKMVALADLVPLTVPDDGRLFYAPWRPDARPMSGLIQGVYAHLGVAGFWRRRRLLAAGREQDRAQTEFAYWRRAAAGGGREVLASGALTPAGERFMAATLATLRSWQTDPVPAPVTEATEAAARAHLARWREDNPGV